MRNAEQQHDPPAGCREEAGGDTGWTLVRSPGGGSRHYNCGKSWNGPVIQTEGDQVFFHNVTDISSGCLAMFIESFFNSSQTKICRAHSPENKTDGEKTIFLLT